MKKSLLIIITILVLLIVGGVFIFNFYINVQDMKVQRAPDFSDKDLDGNAVNLSSYKGKIVILDFVFFDKGTCDHCFESNLRVFEILENIQDKYQDEVEIIVIDMSHDPSGDFIRELLIEHDINLTFINDYFPGSDTNREFNKTSIGVKYQKFYTANNQLANPCVLILDQELKIRYIYQVSVFSSDINLYDTGNEIDEKVLTDNIDRGLKNQWPKVVGGQYISSEVKLLGMFVLGMFISITPCAFAIFVSMTTFVMASKTQDVDNIERKGFKKFLHSNEFLGGSIGFVFTLGLSVVFFIIGSALTFLGGQIKDNTGFFKFFFLLAGIILILFGLNNIFSITIKIKEFMENKEMSMRRDPSKPGVFDKLKEKAMSLTNRSIYLGAFFLGLLMALGWAPCVVTYVFPVYLFIMTQGLHFMVGGLYMFVMAMGFGLPIILVSTLSMSLKGEISGNLISIGRIVRIIFSVMIIILGIYFAFTCFFPQYSITSLLGSELF